MGMNCGRGCKCGGFFILIVGVLFLLRDLGVWDFWNIQWWTVAFIAIGIASFGCMCHHGEACKCEEPKAAPAPKRKK